MVTMIAAGCASSPRYQAGIESALAQHRTQNQEVGRPRSEQPKLLMVGQWALYKRVRSQPVAYEEAGTTYERRRALAIDDCGLWIGIERLSAAHRRAWSVCVGRASLHPMAKDVKEAVLAVDDEPARQITLGVVGPDARETRELFGLLEDSVTPLWMSVPEVEADDVEVPAGHFHEAFRHVRRSTGATPVTMTIWSHPEVPFDGTVKMQWSDGLDVELLGYGDDGAAMTAAAWCRRLDFVTPPFERSFLFEYEGAPWGQPSVSQFSEGARLVPNIDALLEFTFVENPVNETASLDQMFFLFGLRWFPFRPREEENRFVRRSSELYVKAGLGYATYDLETDAEKHLASGLGVEAAVGWLGEGAKDWRVGFELDEHIGIYNAHQGLRQTLAAMFVLQFLVPFKYMH